MNSQQMLDYANEIVEILVDDAEHCEVSHEDMLKAMMIAMQLLKVTYPCQARMFQLAQEAEGELALMIEPVGLPC